MEGDPLPCIDAIQEGVADLLSNINPGKSHGPNNLPVCFLQEVSSEIVPVLTLIFQVLFDQGTLPAVWSRPYSCSYFQERQMHRPL